MQHCMQISAAVQADSAKIIMMHVVDLGEAILKKILLFYNSETLYLISLLAKKYGKCFQQKIREKICHTPSISREKYCDWLQKTEMKSSIMIIIAFVASLWFTWLDKEVVTPLIIRNYAVSKKGIFTPLKMLLTADDDYGNQRSMSFIKMKSLSQFMHNYILFCQVFFHSLALKNRKIITVGLRPIFIEK